MNATTKIDVTEFLIGTEVIGAEETLGELTRVVVDPIARKITHLVVEPKRRHRTGRLVPVGLVATTTEDAIKLSCSASDFSALAQADETHFIQGADAEWNYQQSQVLTLPYYTLGAYPGMVGAGPVAVTSDVIPYGEIEICRGDQVHATDGAIGRVQGLVVAPGDHSVTHILLEEGHLWGKKRVAIPIDSVQRVDEDVRTRLTKEEIKALPDVSVETLD
jgi:sporulation protein YlmC with PRC-barrel domain